MLIYNAQKKLVGIDEVDLHALGFTTLSDLTSQTQDFADLFVKKPGFIHNFKHVNWIDFVSCIDITENAKVIIHANSKDFQCTLHVSTMYLTDQPESKAFTITLNNLYALNNTEVVPISIDVVKTSFTQSIENSLSEETAKFTHEETIDKNLPEDLPLTEKAPILEFSDTLEDDLKIELQQHPQEEIFEKEVVEVEEKLQKEEVLQTTLVDLYDNGYVYDPHVASSELGLPVELIEEFIGDFIAQANEFKDDLYTSFDHNDKSTLQILSHKLKGVAANLRIEDALESLTIINTSNDNADIQEHLNTFYKIISKLSGEKITLEQKTSINETPIENDLKLDFKLDDKVEDIELNKKTDIPKLEDDLELDFKQEVEIEESLIKDTTPNTITMPLFDDDIFEPQLDLSETSKLVYDKDSVAHQIGIDIDSFNELFEDYILETKALTDSIDKAIELENINLLQHQALKLKSMSENMRIQAFNQELEILTKTSDIQLAQDTNNKIKHILIEISEPKE